MIDEEMPELPIEKMMNFRGKIMATIMEIIKTGDFDAVEQNILTQELAAYLLALTLVGLDKKTTNDLMYSFGQHTQKLVSLFSDAGKVTLQ